MSQELLMYPRIGACAVPAPTLLSTPRSSLGLTMTPDGGLTCLCQLYVG